MIRFLIHTYKNVGLLMWGNEGFLYMYCRAVERPENPGVPVVIRWA